MYYYPARSMNNHENIDSFKVFQLLMNHVSDKRRAGTWILARITWLRTLGVTKKRICYHGTLVKNIVNLGILAKIMISLCTILHGHGILAKISARLARNLPWILAGNQGFEHWITISDSVFKLWLFF